MFKFLIKRILYALLSLWAVVTITFTIMVNIPGSPFAGEKNLPPTVLANLNRFYGLDQPKIVQYGNYLKSVATFDFGPSMKSPSIKVNTYLENGLPVSMYLGFLAVIVAVVFGLFLGIISALNHNKMPDYLATLFAIVGVSVPSFVMARLLIIVVSVRWGKLPAAGWGTMAHTVLPTIALSALSLAQIMRTMRSNMLEVMGQDYIRTAKAKGVKNRNIIVKHAIRNAILPIITILGTTATNLVTGSFVIEKIFGIPGIGGNLIKAVESRDYPVIMAIAVIYSLILIVLTLVVDIAYVFIDPRIDIIGGAKSE